MNSAELNAAIREICDREDLTDAEVTSSGKCIPYIGWFWREVDFDTPTYQFGIMPSGKWFVGFMENNKWDYEYTRETTAEEWAEIKRLLEVAVTNPTRETTKAAWDYIQKLGGEP